MNDYREILRIYAFGDKVACIGVTRTAYRSFSDTVSEIFGQCYLLHTKNGQS